MPSPTPSFASVVLSFGGQGMGSGKFNNATTIGVDGAGKIYVGERKGGRVQVFDPSGKFVTQWFAGNSKSILYGIAVDRNGSVYLAIDGSIARYEGTTGKLLGMLQYAGGTGFEAIALAPDGGVVALHYRQDTNNLNVREGVHDNLV
jgi:DNA-binding beta-propeller fold protein YncE